MTASPTPSWVPRSLPLVILGAGYTGLRVYQQAIEKGWQVYATSRTPQTQLCDISPDHRLQFDLAQTSTWETIPDPAHLLWCFPAVPFDLVKEFLITRTRQTSRLLVMGSTSAYIAEGHPITEASPLKTHLSRVQTEEYLRTTLGAVLIRLAGLYGPSRHVFDWIRKGKIQNTKKLVNLLHVEDAAAICLQALEHAPDGSTYLASDGYPRTWAEICTVASSKWHIPIPAHTTSPNPGKQVLIDKLRTELQYTFRFPDLYQALEEIETAQA